jgi:hypothetical protein
MADLRAESTVREARHRVARRLTTQSSQASWEPSTRAAHGPSPPGRSPSSGPASLLARRGTWPSTSTRPSAPCSPARSPTSRSGSRAAWLRGTRRRGCRPLPGRRRHRLRERHGRVQEGGRHGRGRTELDLDLDVCGERKELQ